MKNGKAKKAVGEIVIEKGIPIPAAREDLGKFALAIRQMSVGDSFVLPSVVRARGIYSYGAKAGIKLAARKASDGTVRVWRIA